MRLATVVSTDPLTVQRRGEVTPVPVAYPEGARFTEGETVLSWLFEGEIVIAPLESAPPESVVFTSSGTFEKGDYPWAQRIRVRCQGGGGGSGGCAATGSGQRAEAAGGGGGAYAESLLDVDTLDASESVTVGAAGAAGAAGESAGGTGGTSSFGSHVTAGGGGGGDGSAAGSDAVSTGGVGGVSAAGQLVAEGSDGGNGRVANEREGRSNYGGGATLGGSRRQPNSGQALAGRQYGGGASGSRINANSSAVPGAAGAPGAVVVEVMG